MKSPREYDFLLNLLYQVSFSQTKQEEASPDLEFSGSEDDIATREFETAVSINV